MTCLKRITLLLNIGLLQKGVTFFLSVNKSAKMGRKVAKKEWYVKLDREELMEKTSKLKTGGESHLEDVG